MYCSPRSTGASKRAADTAEYRLAHREGGKIAWLYSHGAVVERHDDEEYAYLTVSLLPEERARFERLLARAGNPHACIPGNDGRR